MRDPFFDILKFIAIVLVVNGHVRGAFGCDAGSPYIGNFVVGMNMPLFFIISGYFAARTIADRNWRKFLGHIRGYFWPAAFFSVVFGSLAVGFSLKGCENGLIGYAGRNFLFSPWFLWCLSICYLITFGCMVPRNRWYRGVMWCIALSLLFLAEDIWHAGNVRCMLPFFLLGIFLNSRKWPWETSWGGVGLVVYMIVVVAQGDIWANGLSFYSSKTAIWNFVDDPGNLMLYILRIVNGMLGAIGIMWIVKNMVDHIPGLPVIAPLGRTTLGVYLLHQWLLNLIVDAGLYANSMMMIVGWTVLLFAFCHCFVVVSQKNRLLRAVVWGEWNRWRGQS